ncbi:MAG TPA: tetratricopeptide repeat protein [Polyangia bacterium]
MARLDTTAVWFQRGEDVEAMAETPPANGSEERRVPTMVWVAAGVALSAAIFAAVLVHVAHAARIVDEPLANPSAAATAPAAAIVTQPPPATTPAATAPAATAPAAAAPAATAPVAPRVEHSLDGERLLRHGKPAAALAAFQQTLAQNPDAVRALRGACVALGKLGRVNDGARVCRRALDRAPDDVDTRRALATLYYDGGAYKWSATEWRRVVARAPRDAHARRALRAAEARADRG